MEEQHIYNYLVLVKKVIIVFSTKKSDQIYLMFFILHSSKQF